MYFGVHYRLYEYNMTIYQEPPLPQYIYYMHEVNVRCMLTDTGLNDEQTQMSYYKAGIALPQHMAVLLLSGYMVWHNACYYLVL